MSLVKRLKTAYMICSGSEAITFEDKAFINFYVATRSIIFKLTGGNSADASQMNEKVRDMINGAIQSDGVEEIFKLGDGVDSQIDIFSDEYLEKLKKLKLPNTKIKLLHKLLAKTISDYTKINRITGINFTNKMQSLIDKYNDRKESDILISSVLEDFANEWCTDEADREEPEADCASYPAACCLQQVYGQDIFGTTIEHQGEQINVPSAEECEGFTMTGAGTNSTPYPYPGYTFYDGVTYSHNPNNSFEQGCCYPLV